MAGLVLGCGEGHSSVPVDPVSCDLLDTAGDVLQTVGDGVAMSVHRAGGSGGYGVKVLDL